MKRCFLVYCEDLRFFPVFVDPKTKTWCPKLLSEVHLVGVAFLTDYAGQSGLLALCATFGPGPKRRAPRHALRLARLAANLFRCNRGFADGWVCL